ncbi:MAG TPA: YbaB/EbfC family nucleoid-associated protein [Enhygromyxa sp.]|nr:YbaB/EbfC family nucleoid-associated protein [Enhygromyxa sp.]
MADFDLSQLMQQAQHMREQMEYLQKGLAEQLVEGSAGGGMVKVTMTGAQQVTAVTIDPSALEEDREMLQDLIVAAVNSAIEKSKALAQERLGSMLPPGLNF